ncbi:uncharacterized protein B0H18DRAFT_1084404 [Fomitopsis serialis]|uniref:uncharacterized protein n=1 Tax=Fomitopsis serialis TaxID=139415 RepID=UPI00200809D1|nr:uncharacterized protein B0H18DRAFT_1084404 [Neoantrodia serialis]KAH9928661.1 hypothetical protein B0H18DRAFT_1084404 [Neoantrodia serialis]
MSSFAALMALSATQTRQSEAAVQNALEKERKEREMEAKLRLKRLEEEKREQERQARVEREREARERELQRREEEERARLMHGPKRAARTDGNGALTREEKRKRRMELEMRHGLGSARRANSAGGYAKAGRRLPGGAMDITTTNTGALSADGKSTMSVRQRLAQAPATLIKLNVNKRDTRTIDEILQDRAKAKAKTLQGDEAKEFKDWFGKAKETKAVSQVESASTSRANTPAGIGQKTGLQRTQSGSQQPRPAPTPKSPRLNDRPQSSRFPPSRYPPPVLGHLCPLARRPRPPYSQEAAPLSFDGLFTKHVAAAAKEARRVLPERHQLQIWSLFGKDRSRYVVADVMSDDEDMEAGASDLEREEKRSARIARKEDELEKEQERRHEEENGASGRRRTAGCIYAPSSILNLFLGPSGPNGPPPPAPPCMNAGLKCPWTFPNPPPLPPIGIMPIPTRSYNTDQSPRHKYRKRTSS